MVYSAPVLQEVGQAANVVLGFQQGHGDGAGNNLSLTVDFALGLDD